MLFVNCFGKVVEINRKNYISESDYYIAILNVKWHHVNKKNAKTEDRICESLDKI